MADHLDITVIGLREVIAQLDKAQSRALPEAERVLAKGALNIKVSAARTISGHPHLPAYPSSITYDLYHLPGSARAQIGPDKQRRQGALGNIIEFGTVHNAPIPHLTPALDEEAPRFASALADLGARLLAGER